MALCNKLEAGRFHFLFGGELLDAVQSFGDVVSSAFRRLVVDDDIVATRL